MGFPAGRRRIKAAAWVGCVVAIAACGSDPAAPIESAPAGVLFSYPGNGQLDVPLGSRIVATFSDPVEASALGTCTAAGSGATGGFCLVGPGGVVNTPAIVSGDGSNSVELVGAPLDPGTTYSVFVGAALTPTATNLPASGPLFTFTTRSESPKSAAPTLVAVNGTPITSATEGAQMPTLDQTTTIRLLFSEPLDPRTVVAGANAVELVDASGAAVDATILTDGIHISIDPATDLVAGASYQVKLGAQLLDLTGTPLVATSVALTATNSLGTGTIHEVLRTRQAGDPGATSTRSGGKPNTIDINKPLIGDQTVNVQPRAINAELGDPKALGGPIAFTIRRGQRLSSSGLTIALGGMIPAGLTTGDVYFEFLTDSGGRLFRDPYQAADQIPDNARSPVYVTLAFDIGIFAVEPSGNAVLAQTVLGVQATGTAIATDGVLDIEAIGSLELGLLGVTQAPTNLILELITDPNATVEIDSTPPTLVASLPVDTGKDHPVGDGIDLLFSEPIDIDRARNGGITLEDSTGKAVPAIVESHGSSVVVRPLAPLAYSSTYSVKLTDVADVAGNGFAGITSIGFSTLKLVATGVGLTVVVAHPGAPCALTGGTANSPGRCSGGDSGDDLYPPFTLPANEVVHVEFSSPPVASTIVLGTACNAGTARIEQLDGTGACTAVVPGSLVKHDRSFDFIPDHPWVVGTHYRLTLVSGNNASCDANELCGITGPAGNFDPLGGTTNGAAGGPNLVAAFTATAATDSIAMTAEVAPYTDINASGFVETGETLQDGNRAALRITNTSGVVSSASFEGNDCIPSTPGIEACIYLLGAMPVELGDLQMNCTLPDGTTAPSCVPVTVSAQAIYATSATMDATIVGVATISTPTGTTIMRIRQPASGPVTGFIIAGANDTPQMVVSLKLYMDAPDLSITASSDDLHSKPLTVALAGPVTFLPDGRIAINLASTADVPVVINITAAGFIPGSVSLLVPKGEMKLQLVSPVLRGGLP